MAGFKRRTSTDPLADASMLAQESLAKPQATGSTTPNTGDAAPVSKTPIPRKKDEFDKTGIGTPDFVGNTGARFDKSGLPPAPPPLPTEAQLAAQAEAMRRRRIRERASGSRAATVLTGIPDATYRNPFVQRKTLLGQ